MKSKEIRHFIPLREDLQDNNSNAVMLNLYYYKGRLKTYKLSIAKVFVEHRDGYDTYKYDLMAVKLYDLMYVNRFSQKDFNRLKDTIEPIKEEIANLFLANDFNGIETLLKSKYYEN